MGESRKCLTRTLIWTVFLFLFLFLLIFVVIPVAFKYSAGFQRSVIFPTWAAERANFSDIDGFGLRGVKNFYITADKSENVTLGAWQIIPSRLLSNLVNNQHYNYERILQNQNYSVLLYLHGNGAVRSVRRELYSILRKYFQIIAIDYRGYGDSSQAEMTENKIVGDVINVYKWIRQRTDAPIFLWGHSLGSGVSTHTISDLKAENHFPAGLVLETPFSTITDVMERHPFVKLLSWLPWYRSTMLDPVIDNGFGFESIKYIVDVDCPIMILHAKDDTIVPYDLATKLYEAAVRNRNFTTQGNVTYHLFDAKGYDHMLLYLAPELPDYISQFVTDSIEFGENARNRTIT